MAQPPEKEMKTPLGNKNTTSEKEYISSTPITPEIEENTQVTTTSKKEPTSLTSITPEKEVTLLMSTTPEKEPSNESMMNKSHINDINNTGVK